MFQHHKHFGTKFRYSNFLCKNCTEVFAENKRFLNKFNIEVSSLLMSSSRVIVICQKYFGNHVISSKVHPFAPLLNMRRCTLCTWWFYRIFCALSDALPICYFQKPESHYKTVIDRLMWFNH